MVFQSEKVFPIYNINSVSDLQSPIVGVKKKKKKRERENQTG